MNKCYHCKKELLQNEGVFKYIRFYVRDPYTRSRTRKSEEYLFCNLKCAFKEQVESDS